MVHSVSRVRDAAPSLTEVEGQCSATARRSARDARFGHRCTYVLLCAVLCCKSSNIYFESKYLGHLSEMRIKRIEDEILLNDILHDDQVRNANLVKAFPQILHLEFNQLKPVY
jgi:hypothetical protein